MTQAQITQAQITQAQMSRVHNMSDSNLSQDRDSDECCSFIFHYLSLEIEYGKV